MNFHRDSEINLFSTDERLLVLQSLGDPLLTLSAHVDFEVFREPLVGALYGTNDPHRGGRPPFDPVLMFKVLVLRELYHLADDAIEFQINDRLSFMRFLGLDFGSRVPDAKTVWLFRDRLEKKGLVKILFKKMNEQLESQGIIAKRGQIVDATFVTAPKQRNTKGENEEIKAGRVPEDWNDNRHKLCQKDVDARWTMKNGQAYYGYKDHVLSDQRSKLITEYAVTDASVHDSQALEGLLADGGGDGQKLYADSAYRSEQIEAHLRTRSIRSEIHVKGYRGRPLMQWQKKANTRKSRIRARVEHIFAFMEKSMGGLTVNCRSIRRAETVIGIRNIAYNLKRLSQLGHSLELDAG